MRAPTLRRRPDRVEDPPDEDELEGELLTRVAAGDQAALGVLIDRIGDQVHGVVLQVVRDPTRAAEVTRDVMLEVWSSAGRFDATRASGATWILTMAHRHAVDRVRGGPVSCDRTPRNAVRDRSRPSADDAAQVADTRPRSPVTPALTELTGLQRDVVELAYYHGYTYDEVAHLLDTPRDLVTRLLRDGLLTLRDEMVAVR